MKTVKTRALILCATAAFLFAACASQSIPSPTTQPPPEQSPAASPGLETSQSPTAPPTPSPSPSPSLPPPTRTPRPTPFPTIHPLDDTIPPLSFDEFFLGNVRINETAPDDLAKALGVDESDIDVRIAYDYPDEPERGFEEEHFYCGNAVFSAYYGGRYAGSPPQIGAIGVNGDVPWQTPRDIKVGDTFESVLLKFPRERQYSEDEYGYFYGDAYTWENGVPSGCVSVSYDDDEKIMIRLTAGLWEGPVMTIYFADGVVERLRYYGTMPI